MSTSILIPYRYKSVWRETLFQFVYTRLYMQWPDAEICVGDAPTEDFSRSASINEAARGAHGDVFVICDADTVSNPESLAEAIREAENGRWGFPYRHYYNLTSRATERILRQPGDQRIHRPYRTDIEHDLDYVVSGTVVVPREAFERAGGFNENFRGWGYEDDAFSHVMTKVNSQPYRHEDGFVCHLWHEASEQERFGQPFIEYNRQLFKEIQRTT